MVSGWWEEESARTARVHSGPGEVKRLDQDGVTSKPISFCLDSQGCPLHRPPTKEGKRG